MKKNQTIILAAGVCARMKSHEPRSLLKIKEKTLIDYQISNVHKTFGKDITVVTGYKSCKLNKKLSDSKIKFIENKDFINTNPSHGIKLALKNSVDSVLVMHGDLLFNVDTIDVPKEKSFIIVDTKNQIHDKEVGIVTNGDIVANLSYGLKKKWCQIAFFTGKELKILKEIIWEKIDEKFVFEIINMVIERGGTFHCYEPHNMQIVEIDSVKDLKNEKIKNIDS
jgi:choline kinase